MANDKDPKEDEQLSEADKKQIERIKEIGREVGRKHLPKNRP
jgi:hypothetical protein